MLLSKKVVVQCVVVGWQLFGMDLSGCFKKLAPYAPVHPPEALAARAGLEVGQLVKIDANENPFGAPSFIREAMQDAFSLMSIYPGEQKRREVFFPSLF